MAKKKNPVKTLKKVSVKKTASKKKKTATKAASVKKKKMTIPKKKNGKVDLECFLTSACMQHKGLGNRCAPLQILRNFRDNYLRQFEEGKKLVENYYRIAPLIVEQIEKDEEKEKVYAYIYKEVLRSCNKIKVRQNREASRVYLNMVKHLQLRYV